MNITFSLIKYDCAFLSPNIIIKLNAICFSGGPLLVENMTPKIVTAVQENVVLRCQAASEDILDIAYLWTHNGLRIPHSEYENTNIVCL